ncbi:hypothetical protein C8R47DRAFT_601870 [Mycena vitilis]|nr:hypothetical protein C8R47DRAFT_601870 [Mycena vitilis]
MNPAPAIHTLYCGPDVTHPLGAAFELFDPIRIPPPPPIYIARWKDLCPAEECKKPDFIIDCSWRENYKDDSGKIPALETMTSQCYDQEYAPHHVECRMAIALETPLATDVRTERPAQVWKVNAPGWSVLFVARIYEPLYLNIITYDWFCIIDRCEREPYTRLQKHQGAMVPRFRGVFVAEIPNVTAYPGPVSCIRRTAGLDSRTRPPAENPRCIPAASATMISFLKMLSYWSRRHPPTFGGCTSIWWIWSYTNTSMLLG